MKLWGHYDKKGELKGWSINWDSVLYIIPGFWFIILLLMPFIFPIIYYVFWKDRHEKEDDGDIFWEKNRVGLTFVLFADAVFWATFLFPSILDYLCSILINLFT